MALSKMEHHRVVCEECGILQFFDSVVSSNNVLRSHIFRKTDDTAAAIFVLSRCPHYDSHSVPCQVVCKLLVHTCAIRL